VKKNHVQLLFQNISADQSELLIAALDEAGFEGFEEENNDLKAFIALSDFDNKLINDISVKYHVSFTKTIIEETDWNQVWESGFHPVVVDGFVTVRAAFHEPLRGVGQEIIITPKMSFGTGHHATTHMMISQMKSIDFTGKSVLDFGTGTGILAILAEKLGAAKVLALDHNEWSIANALENLSQNHCSLVRLKEADSAWVEGQFDIILANINEHVILDNFGAFTSQLSAGGVLVISGLMIHNEEDILEKAIKSGFRLLHRLEHHNWLSLKLLSSSY
jgi:ribosomal protein L11 methyltransferase